MRIDGKVAIITGAAGGIGAALAETFARAGATAVCWDLDSSGAERVAAGIRAGGGKAAAAGGDITQRATVDRLVAETVAAHGRLDILVNSAGMAYAEPFLEHREDTWHKTLALNLTGTFFCAQSAARVMVKQGDGRIVNIASVSGLRGNYGRAAYGATKAGVINLTMVMANELGPLGVRVNAIAPGPIQTPMMEAVLDPRQHAYYQSVIPLQRYGRPTEIADAALYLVSDSASFVNGHCLAVDGGFVAAGITVR